ncbi:unnamed protein product [Caenorhabditis sp. 36 PRJEB53466]|nr:unnamed protein product [Caenorhabditis sp. 36 PRJEB53466]
MKWYRPKEMKKQKKWLKVMMIALVVVEIAVLSGAGTALVITEIDSEDGVWFVPTLIVSHAVLVVVETFRSARVLKIMTIDRLKAWKRLLPFNILRFSVLLLQIVVLIIKLAEPVWIRVVAAVSIAVFHVVVMIAQKAEKTFLVKPLIRGMNAQQVPDIVHFSVPESWM